MAAEGSSVGAGLVSDSHRVLRRDTDTRGRFELTDEDVQFDSECLDKDHVIKVGLSLESMTRALIWSDDPTIVV